MFDPTLGFDVDPARVPKPKAKLPPEPVKPPEEKEFKVAMAAWDDWIEWIDATDNLDIAARANVASALLALPARGRQWLDLDLIVRRLIGIIKFTAAVS